jgi:hypothetical protein
VLIIFSGKKLLAAIDVRIHSVQQPKENEKSKKENIPFERAGFSHSGHYSQYFSGNC